MKLHMLAAAALLSLSTTALATTVAGTATPTNLGVDPGLTITGSAGSFSTDLSLGTPQLVTNLFTLGTSEQSVEFDDIFFTHSLDVLFSFSNPFDASGSPITGTTSGFIRWPVLAVCSDLPGGEMAAAATFSGMARKRSASVTVARSPSR